jgi:hypothetical protein
MLDVLATVEAKEPAKDAAMGGPPRAGLTYVDVVKAGVCVDRAIGLGSKGNHA